MITLPDILFTKITKGHGKVVKVQSLVKGGALLPLKNPTDSLLPHQSQADQGDVTSVGIHGIFFNLSCVKFAENAPSLANVLLSQNP